MTQERRFQLNTPNVHHDLEDQPDTATPQETETVETTEEGNGFREMCWACGTARMLVAAPGLIVAKFT